MGSIGRVRQLVESVIEFHIGELKLEEFAVFNTRGDPLSVIVATILSQNTNDKNAVRAYKTLAEVVGTPLKPEALLALGVEGIARAIRVSGMHQVKARAIVNLANSVTIQELEELEPMSLRSKLLSVPGIGYKTADVFLLMYRRYPIFPIDTHIRRILVRYGVVRPGDSYERIRLTVEEELPRDPEYLMKAHLSLIRHGRTVCKALRPRCGDCPVASTCLRVAV